MRLLLLATAALLGAGCGTARLSVPEPQPHAFATLALVSAHARGRAAELVLGDEPPRALDLVSIVGPDSVRGVAKGLPVAVATADVIAIRLAGAPHVGGAAPREGCSTGAYVAVGCATPFLVGAIAAQAESNNPFFGNIEEAVVPLLVGTVVVGVFAYGATDVLTPRSPSYVEAVQIAPLSQFADAPRVGVGLWRPAE